MNKKFIYHHKYLFLALLIITGFTLYGIATIIHSRVFQQQTQKFSSLKKIVAEANTLDEFPPIDNTSHIRPDYTSFYKSLQTSYWKRFLQFFGIIKKSEWSAALFKQLITSVTNSLEQNGFWGDFVLKIPPNPGTKFIIWGDIQGAYHSLLRDLFHLHHLGIINDSLKITKPNHYFIFNGDVINRSPYILETLSLVLRLIEQNPKKVFYIRGTHDNEGYFEFGIKRELQFKAKHLSNEVIPLKNELLRFFNTLPLALYLKIQQSDNFVRISQFGINDEGALRQEHLFCDFLFDDDREAVQILQIRSLRPKKIIPITFRALMKNEPREMIFRKTTGLSLIANEQDAITWTTLSCPTSSFQSFFDFYYDAFTILSITEHTKPWIIELYNQDIRLMKGFEKTVYNFFTGKELNQKMSETKELTIKDINKKTTPSKTSNEITIGCTLDLSKAYGLAGNQLKNGIDLAVDRINRLGGIESKQVKVLFLDDHYAPKKAQENINQFLNTQKIDTILSPLGTETCASYLSLVEEKKILVLFPYTGAQLFRQKHLENYFHYRGSYDAEAKALLEYALKLKKSKFAIFYQDDSYGKEALPISREIFKTHNITQVLEIPHSKHTRNFQHLAQKINDFKPEVLLFYSTPQTSKRFVELLNLEKLKGMIFMGISPTTDVFRKFLNSMGLELIITRLVPNPWTSKMPLVKEYRQEKKLRNEEKSLSVLSLEGYIAASILIEALKKIDTPSSKEKIITYLSSLHNFNLKGLTLTFDPETRSLNKKVWIDTNKEPWQLYQ